MHEAVLFHLRQPQRVRALRRGVGADARDLGFPRGSGRLRLRHANAQREAAKVYAPLWKEDTLMDVAFYLSSSSKPINGKPLETILKRGYQNDHVSLSKKHHFVFQQKNIPFKYDDAAVVKKQLNLTKSTVSQKLWGANNQR